MKANGYKQELVIGSDAVFGGRKLFFEQHGGYNFFDYYTAKLRGFIPEDYGVFWGFEDEKLFEYAKIELSEWAQGDEPFNLTILTVDTHFEDGYVCELCRDEFEGNQYANVMACSSRQVAIFINWIQQQDFYENTTIVLTGDHPTMDSDFCDNIDDSYLRKTYLAIINAPVMTKTNEDLREFSTMDLFPTTLAALGADIKDDRLGLGVNLYSDKKTIIEKYGVDSCNEKLTHKSDFMNKLSCLKLTDEQIQWFADSMQVQLAYDECSGVLSINRIE